MLDSQRLCGTAQSQAKNARRAGLRRHAHATGHAANIGRAVAGTARCKHKIKRAGRFIANHRVTIADALAGVSARLARRKDIPLVVALDWVEVRDLYALVVEAVVGPAGVAQLPRSAITAARAILDWSQRSPAALAAVLAATINAAPNWV